jgi:hypothetical protein
MKKNKLKPTNNLFQDLLNIQALGFEDKFDAKLLSFHDVNSYLVRDKGEVLDKIFYGFRLSRDKSSSIWGIPFSLVSKEVNIILDSILSKPDLSHIQKNDIILDSYADTIINKIAINKGVDLVKEICSIRFIEDEQLNENKLRQVADLCKIYINDFMQPFFDSINSTQEINDKIIEKVEEDQWSEFFCGNTDFKTTIIMKLCNNPRYEKYSIKLKEKMYNWATKSGIQKFQEYHEIYSTLLEYLDSEEYKQDTV